VGTWRSKQGTEQNRSFSRPALQAETEQRKRACDDTRGERQVAHDTGL